MLHLDLPRKAIELLGEGEPNEKVFDVTTNQHTNRILKIIMGKDNANFNKNIHFHCARHTFATIALELGVAIATVQRIMAQRTS
jgi:site-specific recombinase XerD